MRLSFRPLPVAAALAVSFLAAPAALAGPTSWAAVGGGAFGWRQGGGDRRVRVDSDAVIVSGTARPEFRTDGVLMLEAGVGLPDRYPIVVGGLFRVTPMFSAGTGADMAWLARVCTRGYQVGGFGLSVDAGAYARVWGTPSQGFAGSISLGAPLGLTLSFHTMVGSDELLAFGGSISIDLLRLTLHRGTLLQWWPNPEVQTRRAPTASSPLGVRF